MRFAGELEWIFLLPIIVIGSSSILHATGYLHGEAKRRQGWFWLYFFGTLVSMAAVVLVESKLAFLLAWEAMGLFSAGLVGFESATKESKKATYIYLLACQAGALFLILAGCFASSFNLQPSTFNLIFVLAFIGFALKIGFPPFHVWLPEAHPAAPAPASAVMSGAMIPLGFYGLLKFFPILPSTYFPDLTSTSTYSLDLLPPYLFLVFGVAAAVGGILFALPQHNIKKLLAFSSVENMGIVAMGLALAGFAMGTDPANPSTSTLNLDLFRGTDPRGLVVKLALGGAFLHVINHSLLKGALFLGAGSVLRMTGTLDMDRLGGLMKKMPWTGTLFTINALGLSGLPPLNGFVSEALIYAAAFLSLYHRIAVLPAAIVLIALALTGGIAAAVYTKAVSAVFLGEARSDLSDVRETPKRMIVATAALTFASCLMSGTVLFAVPVLLILGLRRLLPRGKAHPRQLTWDCGYEAPNARMAWTGSAFSQPLADTFGGVLKPRTHASARFDGLLPVDSAMATETDDAGIARLFGPLFHAVARQFQRWHLIQNGSLHFYVLMMIVAIVALLVWGALV